MTRTPYATIVEVPSKGEPGAILDRCRREGDSCRLPVEPMMDGNVPTRCEKGHTGKSNHTGILVKADILDQSKQRGEYKILPHERISG